MSALIGKHDLPVHHAERDAYNGCEHHFSEFQMLSADTFFHCFDPFQSKTVVERRLPHWSQAGAVTFITWRAMDSMPQRVLEQWQAERDQWLNKHGIATTAERKVELTSLPSGLRTEFYRFYSNRWHDHLDAGHGACVLRQPAISEIVNKSLRHFDNDRYLLTDFIVMPNHVHLLAAFPTEEAMLAQCESWKHYTATQINRHLGTRGRFWQQEGFDHLVRSEEQFAYLRKYIADNPKRAGLKLTEFVAYSRPL